MAHDPKGSAEKQRPLNADRRQVLLGLGVAAGGALATTVAPEAGRAAEESQVTEAPSGHRSDAVQRVPFYGVNQAGIRNAAAGEWNDRLFRCDRRYARRFRSADAKADGAHRILDAGWRAASTRSQAAAC